MRLSTAKIRGLVKPNGDAEKPMTAAAIKRECCNRKTRKVSKHKFDQFDALNALIDSGLPGAAKAKRQLIDRQTDGRTAWERKPSCKLADAWNPDGKRHARGRDDTGWVNKKNAGKAGKFAGKAL